MPAAQSLFLQLGFPALVIGASGWLGYTFARIYWRRRTGDADSAPRWLWPLATGIALVASAPLWLFAWTILAIAFAGRTM